jgi:hypothetical protein
MLEFPKESMKFEINFEYMPDYVLIRTEGEASARDFDELLTTLVDSPEWVTGTDQIVDHRKLLRDNFTLDKVREIKNIVKNHSKKLGNGCVALVVKGDFEARKARLYELIGGVSFHFKVRICYSINKAVEWIKQEKEFSR